MLVLQAKESIDLLKGHPNPHLLPIEAIKTAANRAFSNPELLTGSSGLLYAPDPGYLPLRHEIAKWLTEFYRAPDPIDYKRICITGGASQNIACVLQVFSDPVYTRHVWMVAPTYFHACRIFEDAGFAGRLRGVPEDAQGLDVDYLEAALIRSEAEAQRNGNMAPIYKSARPYSKIYRHVIYAVPTFSNPSAMTMTLQRRQQLVRLARKYDALVITDDVYDQLQWSTDKQQTSRSYEHAKFPRIVDVDRHLDGGHNRPEADGFGNAVSNGSFSKIAGPGVRTGWAEGSEKMAWGISQCGSSKSGGAPSQLVATFMASMLQSGSLQQHIFKTLQPAYARRYHSMVDAIQTYLVPLGVTLLNSDTDVAGGYFIWLRLPPNILAADVAHHAKTDEALTVAPGSMSAVWGDESCLELTSNLRLCFAWEQESLLPIGIERLGKVIHHLSP